MKKLNANIAELFKKLDAEIFAVFTDMDDVEISKNLFHITIGFLRIGFNLEFIVIKISENG